MESSSQKYLNIAKSFLKTQKDAVAFHQQLMVEFRPQEAQVVRICLNSGQRMGLMM